MGLLFLLGVIAWLGTLCYRKGSTLVESRATMPIAGAAVDDSLVLQRHSKITPRAPVERGAGTGEVFFSY